MPRFLIIKGRLKAQPLYQCGVCSRSAPGATMSIDIDAGSSLDVQDQINRLRLTSNNMPLYWCYDVDNKFKCPSCYAGAAKVMEA